MRKRISKNKIIDWFMIGLDEKSPVNINERFEFIEEKLIPKIGEDDFVYRYEDAIVIFGDWFFEECKKKEELDIHDYLDKCCESCTMPFILTLYFTFTGDDTYLQGKEDWDKYIKMFKNGLDESKENIVEKITYINTYFGLRNNETFFKNNIEALGYFFKWYKTQKTYNVGLGKYLYSPIYIFSIAASFTKTAKDKEREANLLVAGLNKEYNKISYSEKRNINTLLEYILSINKNRTFLICPLDKPHMEPIAIPKDCNDDSLSFIKNVIKGYCACLLNDNGALIFSYDDNPLTHIFNGFVFTERRMFCLEPEDLAEGVQVSEQFTEMDSVIYESADLPFIN